MDGFPVDQYIFIIIVSKLDTLRKKIMNNKYNLFHRLESLRMTLPVVEFFVQFYFFPLAFYAAWLWDRGDAPIVEPSLDKWKMLTFHFITFIDLNLWRIFQKQFLNFLYFYDYKYWLICWNYILLFMIDFYNHIFHMFISWRILLCC